MPSVLAADCVKAISGKSRSTQVSLVLVSGVPQGQVGYMDAVGRTGGLAMLQSAHLGSAVGKCSFTWAS